MQQINLLLEDAEIVLLRMQARMLQLLMPEETEKITIFVKKILDATSDLNPEWKNEIGKMQRAMRIIKQTPQFSEFWKHNWKNNGEK